MGEEEHHSIMQKRILMHLKELAEYVEQFITPHGDYWDLPRMLAALTEELG